MLDFSGKIGVWNYLRLVVDNLWFDFSEDLGKVWKLSLCVGETAYASAGKLVQTNGF